MKPHSQRGVALVITLVMLAVVTLMAITFLAVSRRERSSVSVTEEQTTARLMAQAAVERATTETLASMLINNSFQAYGMAVSTNYSNPLGFDPSQPPGTVIPTNVNFDFVRGSGLAMSNASEAIRLQNLANLLINPRAPVYVPEGAYLDFRFYLDLNRNRRFETNGLALPLAGTGRPAPGVTNAVWFVGDPEYIGVLQQTSLPHSSTNRFVGRYAYLVLPAGKSLDWNFIHNNARLGISDRELGGLGYYRNQGVGSWELNLGALLHDLNINAWPQHAYDGLNNVPLTAAGEDALGFLRYRYATNYGLLAPATRWFIDTNGVNRAVGLERDYTDSYADGPAFRDWLALTADNDLRDRPWPGSDNPNTYFELNDLFDTNRVPAGWLTRLRTVQQGEASYDRYTYYRMLDQIGTDSSPTSAGRIHLNYDNQWPYHETNMVAWTPERFFVATASRLIEASRLTNIQLRANGQRYTNFYLGEHLIRNTLSVTNIRIYPYNEYSPVLHRLLQLAVNLYDATTNRPATAYPQLPTVFRPTFAASGTNLFISGFVQVTNTAFLNSLAPLDLNVPADRARLATHPNPVVYNVPFLIGAKKGFPNFNEVALQNVAQVTRKVQVRKRLPTETRPTQTNLMYMLSVSNQFGIETWNSYTQDYRRPFRVTAAGLLTVALTNTAQANSMLRLTNVFYGINFTNNLWPAGQFRLPIFRSAVVVSNEVYQPLPVPHFIRGGTNVNFTPGLGFPVPQWGMMVTNRFYYALTDPDADRVIDFVCLGNMTASLDISREIAGVLQAPAVAGAVSEPANVWVTNRVDGSTNVQMATWGVVNQMDISLGNASISDQQWRSWSADAASGRDKDKAIDLFRQFCGLTPLVYVTPNDLRRLQSELAGKVAYQAPYSPTRKIYMDLSWQANDPLVHYILGDLLDPYNRPNDPNRTNAVRFAVPPQIQLTNVNLGRLNERYRPWGGNPNQSSDSLARDLRVKDPMIEKSDDWEFPTNKFPSLGWIGRVHRGTPWQTVYLKADMAETNAWYNWAGNHGTHPTNDWHLVDLFTTAPTENAARGLLSVNQTNTAAWAAVLSGVTVLVPTNTPAGYRLEYLENVDPALFGPNAAGTTIERIVDGINRTRQWETNRVAGGLGVPYFSRMGRLLATPELTYGFPLTAPRTDRSYDRLVELRRDEVIERIPQQILSLVREDTPRFVVYAFGQALKEAPSSVYLGAGPFNRMCTNYQVKSEFISKSVIRIEGTLAQPRAVVESYNELFSE